MGGSIQLARLFGIRIGASPSWFVVLVVMVYVLTSSFGDVLGGSETQALVVAVLAAVLFFVSILLHELGHARVAQRAGIGIDGIDLWFFGGVAKLDRDTRSPSEEFRISAAGPAVTAAIVVLAAGAAIAASSSGALLDVARFTPDAGVSPAVVLLAWLAEINLFLLVFNLIPAFPLDGGRIARAAAWRATGDRHRATRIAGRMGQGFSLLLIGFGVFVALQGDAFNGIWFAVIGFFLGQSARDAVIGSRFTEAIDGVTVADVMATSPYALAGATALPDARARLEQEGWPWSAVVAEDGRFLGVLEAGAGGDGTAGEAADRGAWAVVGATPLEALLGSPALRHLGALLVVDDREHLVGVVTLEQVHRALAAAAPGR